MELLLPFQHDPERQATLAYEIIFKDKSRYTGELESKTVETTSFTGKPLLETVFRVPLGALAGLSWQAPSQQVYTYHYETGLTERISGAVNPEKTIRACFMRDRVDLWGIETCPSLPVEELKALVRRRCVSIQLRSGCGDPFEWIDPAKIETIILEVDVISNFARVLGMLDPSTDAAYKSDIETQTKDILTYFKGKEGLFTSLAHLMVERASHAALLLRLCGLTSLSYLLVKENEAYPDDKLTGLDLDVLELRRPCDSIGSLELERCAECIVNSGSSCDEETLGVIECSKVNLSDDEYIADTVDLTTYENTRSVRVRYKFYMEDEDKSSHADFLLSITTSPKEKKSARFVVR